jgi:hypothetical protein
LGYPHFGAGFHDVTHALSTRRMAQAGGHVAFFGPATISIHDDGNVLRQGGVGSEGQQKYFDKNKTDFQ